jgi:hypothetical protein
MAKVSELAGAELDYWVAKALGHNVIMFAGAPKVMDWQKQGSLIRGNPFMPSTHWAQGGPLIEEHKISIERCGNPATGDTRAYAYMIGTELEGQYGETALEAAMRALVASHFGDTVPDEVPA